MKIPIIIANKRPMTQKRKKSDRQKCARAESFAFLPSTFRCGSDNAEHQDVAMVCCENIIWLYYVINILFEIITQQFNCELTRYPEILERGCNLIFKKHLCLDVKKKDCEFCSFTMHGRYFFP